LLREKFLHGVINLLRTHHQCEACTWCDITHDVSQAVVLSVRTDTGCHTTWLMASVLTGFKPCWLFCLE